MFLKVRNLLSLIAPPLCGACAGPLVDGENVLCAGCLADIPRGVAAADADSSPLRQRMPRSLPLARIATWTIYDHGNPAAGLITRGKYGDRPELIKYLGRQSAACFMAQQALDGVDAIQAVPMSTLKRLVRGYNQAEIVADIIAEAAGVPVLDALKTTRGHRAQAGRSATARAANVQGLFAASKPADIAGRHIALVDDIITTGSTIGQAAIALRDGGARAITILALASTAG